MEDEKLKMTWRVSLKLPESLEERFRYNDPHESEAENKFHQLGRNRITLLYLVCLNRMESVHSFPATLLALH